MIKSNTGYHEAVGHNYYHIWTAKLDLSWGKEVWGGSGGKRAFQARWKGSLETLCSALQPLGGGGAMGQPLAIHRTS